MCNSAIWQFDMEMLSLDKKKDSMPKYRQVGKIILEHIREKGMKCGDKVPGERALSKFIGVSPVTVSRGLGELVKNGVLERRAGSGTYITNLSPSRKTNNIRTKRIGLISRYPSDDAYLSGITRGIAEELHINDFDLITIHRDRNGYLSTIKEHGLAGLVLVSPFPEHIREIEQARITDAPIIIIGFSYRQFLDISFSCDDELGGKSAAEYLIGLGHRRIGALGVLNHPAFEARVRGFQKGMFEAELPVNPEWILKAYPYEGTGVQEGLLVELSELLEAPDCPTAFFAASPYLLLTAYAAAEKMGLSIPNDLSLIGFDEVPNGFYVSTPPTVFLQPFEEIGKSAAEGILAHIRGEKDVKLNHYCKATLVERLSCRSVRREER